MSANYDLPEHDVRALEYAVHRYLHCRDHLDFRNRTMTVFVQGDYQRFTIDYSLREALSKISLAFAKEKPRSRKLPELQEVSVAQFQLSSDEISIHLDRIKELINLGAALIRNVLDAREQTIRTTFEKLVPSKKIEVAKLA